MSIYLWLAEAILGVLWLYCLYAIMYPKDTVGMTIDKFNRQLDFYALKAVIKPTKRSTSVIRWGHFMVMVIVTLYMILIYLFGTQFLVMMAG